MRLTIPKPLDMHVHFRQEPMTSQIVPYTACDFSRALVMPNTKPAIQTPHQVVGYRQMIMASVPEETSFLPLMTFEIRPDTDPALIAPLQLAGVVAGKGYPKGMTTNAEHGIEDYFALFRVLAEMQRLDMVSCWHGEKPGSGIDGLKREEAFLQTLWYIVRTFPRLRIVLEHITTAAAVQAVLEMPETVAATITVHHLLLTHDDVGGDRMRPHHYCKPVAKFAADRDAVRMAALSGCPKFFFGSDSAPHLTYTKECGEPCAGIFTAPVALPLLAQIFEQYHALDRLQRFVHDNAVAFYRLSPSVPTLTLAKSSFEVPPEIAGAVPFFAGQRIDWCVEA